VSAAADESLTEVFEAARPSLLGLAYRMLGTVADAEDVVQEAFLRWLAAERSTIERPAAWLTTVTTRLALDRLRSAQRRREEYVGPWVAEPVVLGPGPEDAAELAESLTLGFLAVLDRLAPVERAVFLLADVFAVPFDAIAEAVGKSPAACRQIASRARSRVRADGGEGVRSAPGADRRVIDELLVAVAMGDIDGVIARLAPDAVCVTDGGVLRRAARRPVVGAPRVARFLVNTSRKGFDGAAATFTAATINGSPGLVVRVDGEVDFAATFELTDDGRISAIWLVRSPEKLGHVDEVVALR
jgi:RNA polymerase sigma-70 factor (ECF subfamily)